MLEVAGAGDVLEQLPVRHRRVGLQEGVDARQAVLVEVVVGDDVGVAVQVHAPSST